MSVLAQDVAMTRYCQSRIKYPQPDIAIRPTAHSPIQPQNVRHSGVTSSNGNTKFTTNTPEMYNNIHYKLHKYTFNSGI